MQYFPELPHPVLFRKIGKTKLLKFHGPIWSHSLATLHDTMQYPERFALFHRMEWHILWHFSPEQSFSLPVCHTDAGGHLAPRAPPFCGVEDQDTLIEQSSYLLIIWFLLCSYIKHNRISVGPILVSKPIKTPLAVYLSYMFISLTHMLKFVH